MKKNILMILIVLFSMIIASCKSSSTQDNLFSFEASIEGINRPSINEKFNIIVKTKNISGKPIIYEGSSTIIGAIIYLTGDNGEIIRPNDKPVTKDFRQVTINANQEIKTIWNFEYELIQNSGSYDLHFEFLDSTCIIEDFILIE